MPQALKDWNNFRKILDWTATKHMLSQRKYVMSSKDWELIKKRLLRLSQNNESHQKKEMQESWKPLFLRRRQYSVRE